MKNVLIVLSLLCFVIGSANAALTRTINGVEYMLNDDWDTLDGECVLRGSEYSAQSFGEPKPNNGLPVIMLNIDGTVKSVLDSDEEDVWVVSYISCQ